MKNKFRLGSMYLVDYNNNTIPTFSIHKHNSNRIAMQVSRYISSLSNSHLIRHLTFKSPIRFFSTVPSPQDQPPDLINTQPRAVYVLPFYGAEDIVVDEQTDKTIRQAVKAYGGLVRTKDAPDQLRERLRGLTRASFRPKQLTMEGVVISNKMQKSVVIAAERRCFSAKLQKDYYKTRRFMAHDEFNLCTEGDRVIIRSCRLMSKRKSHVVVQNFGDPLRPGIDQRRIVLHD